MDKEEFIKKCREENGEFVRGVCLVNNKEKTFDNRITILLPYGSQIPQGGFKE